jgi:demethylspheroidene O-methyltransferase
MVALAAWSSLRDRLLASPRFHRLVAAVPGLRWVAQHQSRRLFDLVAGFTYSQVLLSCVRLKILSTLAERPLTTSELQGVTGLSPRSLDILVRAAVSLNLLEWRRAPAGRVGSDTDTTQDLRIGLGMLGAVVAANPAIQSLVLHHEEVYKDLADPVGLLQDPDQQTRLRDYWAYAHDGVPTRSSQPPQSAQSPQSPQSPQSSQLSGTSPSVGNAGAAVAPVSRALTPEQVAEYSELMAASQPLVAEQVLAAYDFSKHRCLLDVGGGQGAFLSAVAKVHTDLRLMLFDLPAVAQRARQRFDAAGLAGRVTCHGGSFFDDPLPTGADIVSLVRVLYDHSDERVALILKGVRRALAAEGGTLLLAEPMSGTPGAEAMGDAYFGIYLLAMGKGRARTPQELRALLTDAGFTRIAAIPTRLPLQTGLIRAYAPPEGARKPS